MRFSFGQQLLTSVNTNRMRSLLAYLVLHGEEAQSREQLAFLLWPDLRKPRPVRTCVDCFTISGAHFPSTVRSLWPITTPCAGSPIVPARSMSSNSKQRCERRSPLHPETLPPFAKRSRKQRGFIRTIFSLTCMTTGSQPGAKNCANSSQSFSTVWRSSLKIPEIIRPGFVMPRVSSCSIHCASRITKFSCACISVTKTGLAAACVPPVVRNLQRDLGSAGRRRRRVCRL